MAVHNSTTVNFSTEDMDVNSTSIELDDDYHISLYGEEKSEFSKTELVYLKAYPPYSVNAYEILTSNGTCIKHSQNNLETVVELLVFEYEKSTSLANLPSGPVTTDWVAGTGSPISINENVISANEKVIGILKCTYKKKFDRLQLAVSPDMVDDQVIVMVGSEINGYDSITVDYTGEGTNLRDVTLAIKDIVTDEIISGATITITLGSIQIFTGTSNEDGKVTVQDLIIGSTYDLLVTAIDYLDNNVDYLNNDSFTVPEI